MSKKFVYKSVFAPFIDDFVAMKEASGCNYLQAKWIFLEFDNYFCQKNVNQTLIYLLLNKSGCYLIKATN